MALKLGHIHFGTFLKVLLIISAVIIPGQDVWTCLSSLSPLLCLSLSPAHSHSEFPEL